MKTRQHKLCFIISIIILLFLWQILLILIAIKESRSGINFNSFDIDLNKTNSSIPRIIHQTWKTSNLATYPINNSHSEWKRLYPDYQIHLWTDEDLDELISTDPYKYLYDIYKGYSYNIQRADLGRLIILHSKGGIYADLDVFPCLRQVENLRLSNASFIIPRSYFGLSLINHFLVAQKSSPIIDYILHEIVPVKFYRRIYILPYAEVFSTGSIFLTRVIRNYLKSSNSTKNFLWILSEDEVMKYVTHYTGRSWHSFDGYILNQIDSNPKSFISVLVFLILFIFILFKYQYSILGFIKLK
ncbi:unnamed protein product [Rotaria sordida]|uniref:Uncharacterized protein n=1 Tax=Rotaria sordida TaxID=392033 RepID=A0A814YF73_9BILA|nr:unnamed protein product [Rotaria sordida]